ncbi:unannotated protein [freshwater metagenome]|uniref:Unannotated protein n=2 Tax=freshwater metagenome TaxID=449393 RepID=A0A6J6GHV4_9ZZZZ|nr:hypothetical protein [Actinomycetota bacterium]
MKTRATFKTTLMSALIAFSLFPTVSQATSHPKVDLRPPAFEMGIKEQYPLPFFWLSGLRGNVPVAAGKQGQGDHPLCASATDPHCANSVDIHALLIIPPCYTAADRVCIEGLEIGAEGKPLESAVLDHEFMGTKTPGDNKLGLPAGGSGSIWTAPSIAHQGNALSYAVVIQASYLLDKKIAASSQQFGPGYFKAEVIPVNMKKGSYCGYELFEVAKDEYFGEVNTGSRQVGSCNGGGGTAGECILTETGFCAAPAEFLPNTRVALTLRMDSKLTGWLFGRMKDVDIAITSLDSKTNKLRVEATSVSLLTATGSVEKKNLANYPDLYAYKKKTWWSGDGKFEDSLASAGTLTTTTTNFEEFAVWEKLMKANPEDNWRWNFASSSDDSKQNCFAQAGKDKLIGLVTTNAPIYWGGAPIFQDGSLNYKVAGLHFKADGTLFKGSYDLAIRSDVARCLYGFSNAPIMANVSVTSSDGGAQNVATELVTEKGGWITLSAKNFTFSSPTIKVKLTQAGSTPQATSKGAKTSSAAPITKKTIACVKGKTTKKVTGNNPTCPTGYTKK